MTYRVRVQVDGKRVTFRADSAADARKLSARYAARYPVAILEIPEVR